jgi:hypothetical protein
MQTHEHNNQKQTSKQKQNGNKIKIPKNAIKNVKKSIP